MLKATTVHRIVYITSRRAIATRSIQKWTSKGYSVSYKRHSYTMDPVTGLVKESDIPLLDCIIHVHVINSFGLHVPEYATVRNSPFILILDENNACLQQLATLNTPVLASLVYQNLLLFLKAAKATFFLEYRMNDTILSKVETDAAVLFQRIVVDDRGMWDGTTIYVCESNTS